MEEFRKLPVEGVAIAQVTCSESNAPCGNRIIEPAGGWVVE